MLEPEIILIVDNVYPIINETSINLFLCGKKISEEKSIRKILIEKYKEHKRINIILPEWIFNELFDKPEYDLISLENILAEDVDKIVLPIESYGTACELGAFSIKTEICEKLIVITEEKYKNSSSFLRYGPMKLVKNSKGHILYYRENEIDKLVKQVIDKTIYVKYEQKRRFNIFNISLLIGLIVIILQPIQKSKLIRIVKEITNEDERISAAIEILIQKEYLEVIPITSHDSKISLNENGYQYFFNLIKLHSRERLVNKLRANTIWTNRKKQHIFRGDIERAKLLEKTSK